MNLEKIMEALFKMMAAMVDRVAGDPIELGIVAIFLIVVLLILFR
jgi:hypothetical protein